MCYRRFKVFANSTFLLWVMIGGILLPPIVAGAEPAPAEETLASAKAIAERRERIGVELTALLANEEADEGERIFAAELLGYLQYRPAIPILIRYIHLERETYSEAGMPMPSALAHFGFAAVPSVIQAYLEHHNDGSTKAEKIEFALTMAIAEQLLRPAGKATKIYLKGLAVQTTDPAKKGKIEHLLNLDSEFGYD